MAWFPIVIWIVFRRSNAGVLNQGGIPPLGGMEGPEKVILNMSNTSIFSILSYLVAFHIQPFNGMAHTEICHIIIIKGVLQCILCL